MKAKTIVGLMACAVLVPAFADTINNNNPNNNASSTEWFSTSASATKGATWSSEPTVESAKLVIDADVGTPATLTPTDAAADENASDGLVTITSKAYLAPSAKADLPTAAVLNNAQVGFAVATESETTSFYAYVRKASTTVNDKTVQNGEWIALTGVNPPANEADTEFKIDIDYQNKKVSFSVKVNDAYVALSGTPADAPASTSSFDFVPVDNTTAWLSDVAAIGSGTITSIDAAYENAVAVVDNVRYGTIAGAYTAAGSSGTVAVWDPGTGAAATEQTAANGLSKAECIALGIAQDGQLAFEPAAANKKVPGKITIATKVAPVDGVVAKFSVAKQTGNENVDADAKYDSDAIPLPLGTGTYKIVPHVSAVGQSND